jgi:hypothetical protein
LDIGTFGLYFFSVLYFPDDNVVALAANGMAAWRSGGISALPFKSALPAAVAPNRSLAAGIFSWLFLFPLHFRDNISIFNTPSAAFWVA